MKTMGSDGPTALLYIKIICAAALMLGSAHGFAQKKPTEAFRIREKDLIPEGIAFDPVENKFYVGSIHKQKIVKVDHKGRTSDFALSLGEVLGMKVDKDQRKLWVCSNSPAYDSSNFISRVYVFSLSDGALEKKYELSGKKKHLFNDLDIASNGDVFITDSDGGGIYVIRKLKDAIEEFIKPGELRYPNGIVLSPDEKRIFVSTGSRSGIVSIDLESKEIVGIGHEKFLLIGIDGLYRLGNILIGIQNVTFPESVLKLVCDEEFTRIVSVSSLGSDISEYNIPTTGTLVNGCLYFIANSQILQVAGNKGKIRNPEKLDDVVVMKVEIGQ